jgi:hypothetical protein
MPTSTPVAVEIKRLDFAREWITFPDPAEEDHEIRADLTWLLSRWTCVFGTSCHGVIDGRADDGCCSHGAFYSDKADEKRTKSFAKELTPQTWQFYDVGKAGKAISEEDEAHGESRRRTRTHEGACIFLNRPGFPAGAGCSLHALALRTGKHPLETKPDVCWQLPIWRDEENRTTVDEREVRTTIISEFDRRQWGSGGEDLHWWCTSSREAHVDAKPLYESYGPELTALIGEPAYKELVRLLVARSGGPMVAPHPATVEAQAEATKVTPVRKARKTAV